MTADQTPTRTSSDPSNEDRRAAARPTRDWTTFAGLVLATLGGLWLILSFVSFPGAEGWGYDYQAYADAAVRLTDDGSLYQAETLDGPYRPGPHGLYMYAPPLGIAVTPLRTLGPETAVTLWFLLHVVVLLLACALMPVPTIVRLAAFGAAALSLAVTRDLILGNVSVFLLLPLTLAWRWLDRPLGSIAGAVAMSVRPTLGILLVWQTLRRQWRAVAWTLGAGLVLIVATLPFVGLDGYGDYLTVLRNLSDVTGVDFNWDLGSVVRSFGAGDTLSALALVAGFALAVVAIVTSLRRDREVGFMVTVVASLLLSPLLWDHYLSMLVLPAAFLASRGRPWALALPLASWLPGEMLPFVVLAAVFLPFLARDAEPAKSSRLMLAASG